MTSPIPDLMSPLLDQPNPIGQVKSDVLAALEHYKIKDASKVVVRFKSIGSAPIMKNNVFKVTAGNKFQAVVVFLRTQLGYKPTDPLDTNLIRGYQRDMRIPTRYEDTNLI
ncbi:ubiquitin-like protein ATG12 [Tremella mesenterica]|uniref:Ubiquitin-like protein ATG12 n=1 Tax=Tremella mesenterica TaxID=5217 RepID=A0A4Q1BNX1_TREME|nr:ubiquitin-like protein ATG12 [Tremella mesenterica]